MRWYMWYNFRSKYMVPLHEACVRRKTSTENLPGAETFSAAGVFCGRKQNNGTGGETDEIFPGE